MYCCLEMMDALHDKNIAIIYYARYREYGFAYYQDGPVAVFVYCPWCGMELPDSLRDDFFQLIEDKYGMDNGYNELDELPEEMRTDEWWRKRCL